MGTLRGPPGTLHQYAESCCCFPSAFPISSKFLLWPDLTQNHIGKRVLGNTASLAKSTWYKATVREKPQRQVRQTKGFMTWAGGKGIPTQSTAQPRPGPSTRNTWSSAWSGLQLGIDKPLVSAADVSGTVLGITGWVQRASG